MKSKSGARNRLARADASTMDLAPRLIQLISDARIGGLFGTPKPMLVLDAEGMLLLANRASLSLFRAGTVADAAATVAAERGRSAAALRQIVEGPPEGAGKAHTLAFMIGGARRTLEFSCSRVPLAGDAAAILLIGREPAGYAPELTDEAAAMFGAEAEAYALVDASGRTLFANAAATSLTSTSESLEGIIPGAERALATSLEHGAAEVTFGVLRVFLRRVGVESNPFVVVAFIVPARVAPAVSSEVKPAEAAPALEAAEMVIDQAAEVAEQKSARDKSAAHAPGRFVWQTDANGRFTSISAELAAIVGPGPAAVAGMDWQEAAATLGIEGVEAVVAAMARRDTWSGVTATWPVEDGEHVRPVDLAALPVFDRERRFLGYRGFGVFREAQLRPRAPVQEPLARADEAKNAPEPAKTEPAPVPVFVEKTENVVPLYKTPANDEHARPTLTPVERNAFREIARAIGARMKRVDATVEPRGEAFTSSAIPASKSGGAPRSSAEGERAVLDRLPIGVVVHRADKVLYANRTLLDWVGMASIEELASAGGLNRLFSGGRGFAFEDLGNARPITIRGRGEEPIPVEARLLSAPWDGDIALVYVLRRAGAGLDERMEAGELALRDAEATAREMRSILDTATDGVALLDRQGRVLGMNRSAEALFGFDSSEIEGRNFTVLFAPESHRAAADYLEGLAVNGVASVLNDGREVIGRVREGGLIPLFMTLGRVGEGAEKFCAVFRDITQWKRAEEELVHARREAERASSAKSEFLAKISHEIRTPLNAIIGFAEVMMQERLGPIGNERYREYLKDIHASGEHLVSLINDLLDLSKIEAGKLDLVFASVDLNEIASQSMALMQPQANRERIIIRTALSPDLPPVVADARSIRQIVLNLLSNSIRFTPPGGQVIVSTTLTDEGEVHLRVRDTGIGMTESEIKTALEPFRQIATAGRGKQGGTGLGLPLTKALVEANRASFAIKSTVNAGTLVEIAFPSTRVLAE
jgi:PAS domain S-box-containing protein